MPAKSKAQRRLMAMALLYKRGQLDSKYITDEIKTIAKGMTEEDLHKFASTKQKKLPHFVKGSKYRKEYNKRKKKEKENAEN